jgi:hypothetical protein
LEITKTTYANDLWQVGGFFSCTSVPKFNKQFRRSCAYKVNDPPLFVKVKVELSPLLNFGQQPYSFMHICRFFLYSGCPSVRPSVRPSMYLVSATPPKRLIGFLLMANLIKMLIQFKTCLFTEFLKTIFHYLVKRMVKHRFFNNIKQVHLTWLKISGNGIRDINIYILKW